ncbi:MAG: DNA mismatch repair protein MutS, partial [Geminicoccaceae bacterium]
MSRTAGALTPMMAQYRAMQADHPGCLLFFRMGDFYELFFEDAERAAAALDITLTRRGHGADGEIPMCGVPFHAVDGYLERLIRKGFKVAICEQLEDPAEAKKRGAKSLVKRDVVRIGTPGTLTEDGLLDARAHNHLAALARAGGDLALAWLDMSTGRFRTQDLTLAGLAAALAAIEPGELLVADTLEQDAQVGPLLADWRARITPLPASRFDSVSAERRLKEVFAVAALDAFGSFARAEIAAAGALLAYVELTQKGRLPRLEPPARLENAAHLVIDAASRRNLELSQSLSGTRAGSLLHAIDRTVTGPGGRLLASRLATPLCAPHAIRLRLDQIEALVEDGMWRDGLRRQLRALPDLPRALSRLSLGRGGPRDLRAIGEGLRVAAALQHELEARPGPLQVLAARSEPCPDLAEQLLGCLIEQPPLLAREGGFIAAGADARLDEERSLRDHGRKKIAAMEADLRGELGIPSLKIRHNNLIGYHIEVSATQRAKVPERFIQRQSMANATRYTTGALAELAEAISEAGMKALKHELALFDGLVAAVNARADAIARTADVLAELDVAAGLADLAVAQRYV